VKDREIESVEINSQLGGSCRIKNPWPQIEVTLYRNRVKAETLSGDLLTFDTANGEDILLLPPTRAPSQLNRKIPNAE
jgi:hypothetical protein